MTYLSGVVDENDLCYLGDTPHNLTDVLGVRTEEIDGLWDGQSNTIEGTMPESDQPVAYRCDTLCELDSLEGAKTHMVYGRDFYRGKPVLTSHSFGKGTAWYLAADPDETFLADLTGYLVKFAGIHPLIARVPEGVSVQSRVACGKRYIFAENYSGREQKIRIPERGTVLYGSEDGVLKPYDVMVCAVSEEKIF